MERRRALVIAGTVTASLAMAGGALAANMGLLGSAGADVGNLDAKNVSQLQGPDPTTAQPDVTVIVQDVPVPAAGSSGTGASAGSSVGTNTPAPQAPAVVTPPSGGYVDDDDHGVEDHDDHGDDEDHDEYEDDDDD